MPDRRFLSTRDELRYEAREGKRPLDAAIHVFNEPQPEIVFRIPCASSVRPLQFI